MNRLSLTLLLGLTVLLFTVAVACSPQAASTAPEAAKQDDSAMMDKKDGSMMEAKDGDAMMEKKDEAMVDKFPDLIRAAHFVDSSPKHGETLAQAPERILINFDFTLHEISTVAVTKDGAPLENGKPTFGPNNLSLSSTLPSKAGNGLYLVKFKACWPDRSCHDGQIAFRVEDQMKTSYQDMRNKGEVLVAMLDLKFQPSHITVSKGTKVVWANRESVSHFLNSDPHPSHNLLPSLNSLAINQGQEYAYTFTDAGDWGYHCSAHYPDGMVGHVLVQ